MLSKIYNLSFSVLCIFIFWTHICPFLILNGHYVRSGKKCDIFSDVNTPKIPHLPVELFMMLVPFCDQSASVHTISFVRSTVIFFLTYLYSNSVDTMPTIRVSLNQFSGLTGQGKKETLHVKFFLFNLKAYFLSLGPVGLETSTHKTVQWP